MTQYALIIDEQTDGRLSIDSTMPRYSDSVSPRAQKV